MTESSKQPVSPSVDQPKSKTILLMTLAALCVLFIGLTGVMKYKLDQAASLFAAPSVGMSEELKALDKIDRVLGYGGFIGSAQRFVQSHALKDLSHMQKDFDKAQKLFQAIEDKIAPSTRQDIDGLTTLYSNILAKAEASKNTDSASINFGSITFSESDLIPALMAYPSLEIKLQKASHTLQASAQRPIHLWGMGLMLMAWFALIFAASMTAAFLFLRKRPDNAPLDTLAQSLKNLSKGDMDTPIWGIERKDTIGELARSIDLARYRFSQLPDISVLSDQGPVRLKFEGETRSLFQAMMNNITAEYDHAKTTTASFTDTLRTQQEAITELSNQLAGVSSAIKLEAESKDAILTSMTDKLALSIDKVEAAQDKTAKHLSKIVPFMQERAQNMAEVTHTAGTKVAQTLQNLLQTSHDIHINSSESKKSIKELASATNDLSERLFGAVNLMQASGKALTEVTDSAKTRFQTSVELLTKSEESLQGVITRTENRLTSTLNAEEKMDAITSRTEESAQKMAEAVRDMADHQEKLNNEVTRATESMSSIVGQFDDAKASMNAAVDALQSDSSTLGSLLAGMEDHNKALIESTASNQKTHHETIQKLADYSEEVLKRLEAQITKQTVDADVHLASIATKDHSLAEQALEATSILKATVDALKQEQDLFAQTRAQFSDKFDKTIQVFETKGTDTFAKTEKLAEDNNKNLTGLSSHMEEIMQRLDMLGQLTGTLGTVAGQLGQVVPSLSAASHGSSKEQPLSQALITEIQGQWRTSMMQLEAMHDQLAQLVIAQKDQLETRLTVMDRKIKSTDNDAMIAQQTTIMNDIVVALGRLSDHIVHIEEIAHLNEDDDAREA